MRKTKKKMEMKKLAHPHATLAKVVVVDVTMTVTPTTPKEDLLVNAEEEAVKHLEPSVVANPTSKK